MGSSVKGPCGEKYLTVTVSVPQSTHKYTHVVGLITIILCNYVEFGLNVFLYASNGSERAPAMTTAS